VISGRWTAQLEYLYMDIGKQEAISSFGVVGRLPHKPTNGRQYRTRRLQPPLGGGGAPY
jgi:hypothetical protein